MELEEGKKEKGSATDSDLRQKNIYRRLYRRFIGVTLVCSLLPLLLVGWGIYLYYSRFAASRMMEFFQTQVEHHRRIIELFLKERSAQLQLIAHTHSLEYLREQPNLVQVFHVLNLEYGSLTDLGIIDDRGKHLAYVGPYDLMDKDYSQTFWFKEVMAKEIYISDMFMGFRKVPHFIIAVGRSVKGKRWILRATIDTEAFRSLVENVKVGKTGEVYLLNQEGIFQTAPRFSGKIMERAPFPLEPYHEGIRIRIMEAGTRDPKGRSPRQIVAQTWIKEPRWRLVVKQDYSEAFSDVNHANYATLLFLHLSGLTILLVSVLTTRHMIGVIRKRDEESARLNRQLMQAGKLASIGELSSGVAHEINNPLAIILTERQILLDLLEEFPNLEEGFRSQLLDSLSQIDIQIQRCKRITQNLLRFSRRTKSVIEEVDLNSFIREVIELMEREAKTSGIKFFVDLEENLPPLLSDPSQLQQVFLNLITNAIDAHEGKPYGTIRIRTRSDNARQGVEVAVADTGSGIPPENIERIFDPFFTTKPVGKGTGLGLSICYGIVEKLGGTLSVQSEVGKGTEFVLFLPYHPPPEWMESISATDAGI